MLDDIDSLFDYAITAHENEDFIAASTAYSEILKKDPQHPDANHNFGLLKIQLGPLDESLIYFKNAIKFNPYVPQFWVSFVDTLTNIGKFSEAKSILSQAKELGHTGEIFDHLAHNLDLKSRTQGNKDVMCILKKSEIEEAEHKSNANVAETSSKNPAVQRLLDRHPPAAKTEKLITMYNQGHLKEVLLQASDLILDFPKSETLFEVIGAANRGLGNLQEAVEAFDKVNSPRTKAQSLECIYKLGNYKQFNKKLSYLASNDPHNLRVAAISSFAAHQLRQEDIYPFCKEPLGKIQVSNIKNYLSNSTEFISELLTELYEVNSNWEPTGKATKNGFQSSNKILDIDSPNINILKNIILNELAAYRAKFTESRNLIIKNWPDEMKLSAWFVRLLSGGYQNSHIHPSGWVSGVFYLKTVKSPTHNEGAIKFGIHGYEYPIRDKKYPTKIHQPENGDLVLFPSSLFHETIPVKQAVERCVIAFDLLK